MDFGATPPLNVHGDEGGRPLALRRPRALGHRDDDRAPANRDVGGGAPDLAGPGDQVSEKSEMISLDLFATAYNTLIPRFFARYLEPLAEGADTLAQLGWGWSRCSHCSQHHRECAFAFLPRGLLAAFVAKARSDGLRCVIVVLLNAVGPGVADAGYRCCCWCAAAGVLLLVYGGNAA